MSNLSRIIDLEVDMTANGNVFVTRELPEKAMDVLRSAPEIGELRVNPHDRVVTREELLDGVKWCDALLSLLTESIDAEVMDAQPRLKVIANYAVGFNNIDIDAANERKIPVSNTPGVLTETTADLAWTLLMSVARYIVPADHFMRAGKYKGWSPLLYLGQDIFGKTLGIVGLGRIGYAMAKRAQGFDMRVLYSDVDEKAYASEVRAEFVDLDTLLNESDFVTLHPFLDDETNHLMNEERLRMMKSTAYLINASRGPVIDEKALAKALQEGWIAGAGLDVFEREPEMEPDLADMENVVVVPHIASATIETRTKMGLIAADNVLAALRGDRPPTIVNPEIYD
jgi:glyoxylate reductase